LSPGVVCLPTDPRVGLLSTPGLSLNLGCRANSGQHTGLEHQAHLLSPRQLEALSTSFPPPPESVRSPLFFAHLELAATVISVRLLAPSLLPVSLSASTPPRIDWASSFRKCGIQQGPVGVCFTFPPCAFFVSQVRMLCVVRLWSEWVYLSLSDTDPLLLLLPFFLF